MLLLDLFEQVKNSEWSHKSTDILTLLTDNSYRWRGNRVSVCRGRACASVRVCVCVPLAKLDDVPKHVSCGV